MASLGEAIRKGQEEHETDALLSAYADDAEITIVDTNNPPSRPRKLRGKEEIAAYWRDVLSRGMTHKVESVVEAGDRAAYQVACEYPDGNRVLWSSVAEVRGDRIASETVVQAWDG